MLTLSNHKIKQIPFLASPFCNERPTTAISLLVIHSISLPENQYGTPYIEQLFTHQIDPTENALCAELATYQVSAHLLIKRSGATIQFVPFNQRAWHAGLSHFNGRENCNDFSIGIELEGSETDYFTLAQYTKLTEITHLLCQYYPIKAIVGHEHIAPGRKKDPGIKFNWLYYQQSYKQNYPQLLAQKNDLSPDLFSYLPIDSINLFLKN